MSVSSAAKLTLASALLIATACAHTPTEEVFQNMILAGVAGIAMGQQKEEYKTTHSLMYGGLGAAAAGAVTLYLKNPDKETERMRTEVLKLKAQIESFSEPELKSQTPGTFGARVPDKYRAMISPGEWRIYEINQWIEDGENRIIHQDKIMELIPPSLRPMSKPTSKGNL